jgi:pimeloyl-ACP methyl ester carboxylesterase
MRTRRGSLGRTLAALAVAATLPATGSLAPAGAAVETSPAALASHPVVHSCHSGRALCGSIRVPLYWSLPSGGGRRLQVRFRIYPHTDAGATAAEPVVAFEGGPGYGSIGSAGSYLALLGPLRATHDLIVMDQRGTGTSDPIHCPALQQGTGNFVDATAACARRLGSAANAYGSAAVAQDMHAILSGLGITKVDVYGDSYGTYAAQSFTLHHPEDVRALVLDGAYDDSFDPFERPAAAAMRAMWKTECAQAQLCDGILGRLAKQTEAFTHDPLVGVGRTADGVREHVRVTATDFAQLVNDGTYVYTVMRDLPAALHALAHGDRAPMLRLAADHVSMDAYGGSPSAYSWGDFMAVSCHDYPTIWDTRGTYAERRSQLDAAIAALRPDAFAPFPNAVWLHSLYEQQLVYGCLKWPRPAIDDPALPAGPRPDIPVLVTNGAFDQSTPAHDARLVAEHWPNSTLVVVPNTVHITALADFQSCASVYVRRFLETLEAGDTSCASAMPPMNVVARFPVRLAGAPEARSGGGDDRSTTGDRKAAWVASQTVGDALSRWYNLMYGSTGHGLRGGRYATSGSYYGLGPVRIAFRGTRFVSDLSVSGPTVWNRQTDIVHARLSVAGPRGEGGTLTIRFPTNEADGVATITGALGGRHVDVVTAAPWMPLG